MKKINYIKTFKALAVFVFSRNINLNDIYFRGWDLDYMSNYEILYLIDYGNCLEVKTNIFGLMIKEGIMPDVYRQLIQDNLNLRELFEFINDFYMRILLKNIINKLFIHSVPICNSMLSELFYFNSSIKIKYFSCLSMPIMNISKIYSIIFNIFRVIEQKKIKIENSKVCYVKKQMKQPLIDNMIIGDYSVGSYDIIIGGINIYISCSSKYIMKIGYCLQEINKLSKLIFYSNIYRIIVNFSDSYDLSLKLNKSFLGLNSLIYCCKNICTNISLKL